MIRWVCHYGERRKHSTRRILHRNHNAVVANYAPGRACSTHGTCGMQPLAEHAAPPPRLARCMPCSGMCMVHAAWLLLSACHMCHGYLFLPCDLTCAMRSHMCHAILHVPCDLTCAMGTSSCHAILSSIAFLLALFSSISFLEAPCSVFLAKASLRRALSYAFITHDPHNIHNTHTFTGRSGLANPRALLPGPYSCGPTPGRTPHACTGPYSWPWLPSSGTPLLLQTSSSAEQVALSSSPCWYWRSKGCWGSARGPWSPILHWPHLEYHPRTPWGAPRVIRESPDPVR